jgi:hypothetical protein
LLHLLLIALLRLQRLLLPREPQAMESQPKGRDTDLAPI